MSSKRRRECARYVQMKDVPTLLRKVVYVLGMVQRSKFVDMKVVPTMLSEMKYALNTEQSQNERYAQMKNVPN